MKGVTAALGCALLFSSCVGPGIDPKPHSCGVDIDDSIVILIMTTGGEEPDLCLRVPPHWREHTQALTDEEGETAHQPLKLTKSEVPLEGLSELKPAPEEWFLRYDAEASILDVLVELDGQHRVVGAVSLSLEPPKSQILWEKFSSSVSKVVTELFELAGDLLKVVGNLAAHLLFGWLDGDTPAPWEWGDDDDDDDDHESSSGLIFPAHGDS